MQERLERLIELSGLPVKLRKVNKEHVTLGVQSICNNMFATTGIIYLHGAGIGKSTNAAALLLSYLRGYCESAVVDNVGLYVSAYELCLHNRSRFSQDAWLMEQLELIKTCKCLVLEDIFSYVTQFDDMLLQTVFNMRQYCDGVTVFTSGVSSSFDCAGSILQRIERSAKYKEEFK